MKEKRVYLLKQNLETINQNPKKVSRDSIGIGRQGWQKKVIGNKEEMKAFKPWTDDRARSRY